MLTKVDEKITDDVSDDDKAFSSPAREHVPFQLLFRRERTKLHPLTGSASLSAIEDHYRPRKPVFVPRGFIPDSSFDTYEYDLKDTGLPGFEAMQAYRNKSTCIVKTSSSSDSESTQLTNNDGETECTVLRP